MWDIINGIGLHNLLAFIGGGLLVNLTPGQDVFFATASGIQGGPRAGVMAGLGVGLGCACGMWHFRRLASRP